MLIRAATPADIPAIRNLDLASPFGARWSDLHYHELFARADRFKHLVLLAEDIAHASGEKHPAAYLVASGVGAEWELENVVVATTMLRRGIARALIEELLEGLRRDGVTHIHLEVRESNSAARALYAALGFVEENRRPEYYANPAEAAIILAKTL
ncbi:MAG: GNAT family N-acetyltransferase [Terriglobales bacterium]